MSRLTLFQVSLVALVLTLVGFGCTGVAVSDLSEEDAAAALTLSAQTQITMRPTVLGIGGTIAGWLGSETDDREISVTSWVPGESVGLSWQVVSQVETDDSKARQEEYDTQYAETPIGVQVPERPEREYEDVVRTGTISSTGLADSSELYLPDVWPEGEADNSEETSLIWISQASYDELVSTRKTTLSLGLFDESLIEAGETTTQVKSFVDQVKDLLPNSALSEEAVDTDGGDGLTDTILDITSVEADGDWGTYTLSVDGVRTKVQTIEAGNSFASFTILANRDNPIVLEIQLTPLAQGSLEALNPANFASSFSGYEIYQINSVIE